jgi:hypothetical protein
VNLRVPLAVLLTLCGCAAARPVPVAVPTPPPPPPTPTEAERLDEASRLLKDGVDLALARTLIDGASPSTPRRDLLLGQLDELSGDDEAACEAYGRYLACVDDDEVRLRRALLLERLGRGDEAKDDLARLRPNPEAARPADDKHPARKLRPLR